MKTLTIAIAAAATAAIAPTAMAQDFSFKYTFNADEVSTSEGAAKVLKDLERKIERECTSNTGIRSLKERALVKECVNTTMANTIAQTTSPTLAAAYSEQQSQG